MSAGHPRPARIVKWLLTAVSSRTPAEAVVGDILEELDERRAAGRGPRWTGFWMNRQALRFVAASVATTVPRAVASFGHTVRDAARALRRSPAHALFILSVLAVGISAATVTFSVVDAVVFKPLPFDHSEEIVMVTAKNVRGFAGFTVEQFWAIHDRVPGLDGVATMSSFRAPIEAAGGKEEVVVMTAMADLFRVLRLKALQGRLWTPDDETRGDTAVTVIGHALWQRRFGGDPAVLGQVIRIKDTRYKIVGILPADAVMPERSDWPVEMWVPQVPARVADARSASVFSALARVRPGVSPAQVVSQIANVTTPLISATQAARPNWRPEVQRWDEALVGDVRSWLMLLLGTVSLIVLIACFNAANLMLTRSAQRARELAVRASLGASRRQLAMTLLVESLMLSSAACLCGLVLATWGVEAVKTGLPVTLFRADSIAVNGRVFAAAMAAALVTGVLFGTVPAWQASRVSVVSLLKDGGTTATSARRRWRSFFLTAEIASIAILLVVSTLFVMSFVRAATLDLGFDRSNLIGVATIEGFSGTVEDVRSRFAQIPGVTGVAAVGTTSLPLVAAFGGAFIDSPLTPVNAGADASADVELYRVTPNYFDVMSIPFLRGSAWSYTGTSDFQPMVVDEAAARRMFGDRDPIGQQVRAKELNDRVFTIVGTVPLVLAHGPEQSTSASPFHARSTAYYQMIPTSKPSWVSLLVRTGPPPAMVAGAVEAALASVAPPSQSGGAGVHLFNDGFRLLTARRRFNAGLMAVFAIFAMFIGAAGIFAVMASVVAQQTKEIGIRLALGATAANIRRGVLAMAARHAILGLAAGLPAAWWISRGFGTLFFQVRPTDASIYIIVAALLSAVSLAGAVVPARRAARVDPMVSLRAS